MPDIIELAWTAAILSYGVGALAASAIYAKRRVETALGVILALATLVMAFLPGNVLAACGLVIAPMGAGVITVALGFLRGGWDQPNRR